MFGALVDRESLRREVAGLLSIAAPHAGEADVLAVAVRLAPAGDVREGDPADTGRRQSGTSGFGSRGAAIELAAEFAVDAAALRLGTGDLADELAVRVLNDVRQLGAR